MILLELRMALLERAGTIVEGARVVNAAIAVTAEAGVCAAIERTPITEARTSTSEAAGVVSTAMEAAKTSVETAKSAMKATAAESTEAAAECRRAFDSEGKAGGRFARRMSVPT